MRAYLSGRADGHLGRVARILGERGWQVAADGRGRTGRWEIAVVEPSASDRLTMMRLAALRDRLDPDLLLLLADPAAIDRGRALALGADDLWEQGLPATLAVARLMALLRLRSDGFCESYDIGELSLDLARRRVRRGGRELLLSQREFQLLVLLAREAGAILPRSAIIEALWQGDPAIADNAVDALVSRLRRRIDGPFPTKMLQTVRGVGYCLSAPAELRLAS